MKIVYGVIAGNRCVGPKADDQYSEYVGDGLSLVMIDWDGEKATGSAHMAGVSGHFELAFDSRDEAAQFYLSAHIQQANLAREAA